MSFYTDAVKELEVLFDAVNARWFKGELDPPIITIMASKKAYGWFYADSWEDSIPVEGKEASKLNELNISPEYLSRSVAEICVTLCHEACHLFAHQTGQQDTSNNHAYHNRVFKSIAEDHIGALRAISLEPLASHGATPGGPVRRSIGVGARRRGVPLHGYQENAGGCHPPGRNTDCRH